MSTTTQPQTFDATGLPTNEAPKPTREQWLQERKKQIGASDVAAILGLSPWSTAWEVWAEKTNRLEPWVGNESTRLGQAAEAIVLDAAEADLGKLVRDVRVVHPTLPMASTLDGRVLRGGHPVEAKTTGLAGPIYGQWGDALTDQVPDYYLVQVHAQLLVTGAELAYLFALIAGRGVVKFQFERNDKLAERIGEICNDWWEAHVIRDCPPEFTTTSLEVVKRLRKQAGKRITLGGDVLSLHRELEAAKKHAKQISDLIDSKQAQILLALGDAEEAELPDGSLLTHYETTRKGYEVKESKFRTLRIKKAKSQP